MDRYLLTYDPLAFHSYLETIIASNSISAAGNARHNQSPWLLTDAAHIIFSSAKRRCYTLDQTPSTASPQPRVEDELDDEEGWNALNEMEFGRVNETDSIRGAKGKGKEKRPRWLPKGMEPVLEELPKWNLLADVLKEIEDEIMRQESLSSGTLPPFTPSSSSSSSSLTTSILSLHWAVAAQGTNTVLVMTSSTHTSNTLSEFLSNLDPEAEPGAQGRKMLEEKLRLYLWWKSKLSNENKREGVKPGFSAPPNNWDRAQGSGGAGGEGEISEALRRKDKERRERQAGRRRVRGGAASGMESTRDKGKEKDVDMTAGEEVMRDEAESIADL